MTRSPDAVMTVAYVPVGVELVDVFDRASSNVAYRALQSAGEVPLSRASRRAALSWLGERLYYLAAIEIPLFGDRAPLVDTLTAIWMRVLYAGTAD